MRLCSKGCGGALSFEHINHHHQSSCDCYLIEGAGGVGHLSSPRSSAIPMPVPLHMVSGVSRVYRMWKAGGGGEMTPPIQMWGNHCSNAAALGITRASVRPVNWLVHQARPG